MGARGKTLVPLLVVVVAAAVALQSTYLQVEPVDAEDAEKPGELLWGYCCGTGGSEGRWGEGEVLLYYSLPSTQNCRNPNYSQVKCSERVSCVGVHFEYSSPLPQDRELNCV